MISHVCIRDTIEIDQNTKSYGAPTLFGLARWSEQVDEKGLHSLLQVTKIIVPRAKRVQLLGFLLFALAGRDDGKGIVDEDIVDYAIATLREVGETNVQLAQKIARNLLFVGGQWVPSEGVAQAFDKLAKAGKQGIVSCWTKPSVLVGLFNQFPMYRGLLPLITLATMRSLASPGEGKTAHLDQLSTSAFEVLESDTDRVRGAVSFIRLLRGNWADGDGSIASIVAADTYVGRLGYFGRFVDLECLTEHPKRRGILVAIIEEMRRQGSSGILRFVEKLNSVLDQEKSPFADRAKLAELSLPC